MFLPFLLHRYQIRPNWRCFLIPKVNNIYGTANTKPYLHIKSVTPRFSLSRLLGMFLSAKYPFPLAYSSCLFPPPSCSIQCKFLQTSPRGFSSRFLKQLVNAFPFVCISMGRAELGGLFSFFSFFLFTLV